MKKTITKLTALALAMLLLFSLCISAAAAEYELSKPENLLKNDIASECAADGSSVSIAEATDNAAGNAKPVGIFALKVRKGTAVESMGAFLVQSGGTYYIMTHAMAAVYAADGYELTLMGMDGENHEAVCIGVAPDVELAFLSAGGMSDYEPLKFSRKSFETAVTVALSYCNSNYTSAKYVEYRTYDMGRITQLTDMYYGILDREVSLQWLGSPILPDKGALEVQGICSSVTDEDGAMLMALITFDNLALDPAVALGATPVEEEAETTAPTEPQPEPAPEPALDGKLVLILVLAAAGVAYYFYSNNKKKKQQEEQKKAAAQPVEVTLPVEPMVTHGVTRPLADWVLQCTGGPLNGKSFPASGTLLIGRSSQADVVFPDNTPGISGRHCEITVSADRAVVKDLNSSYGTFVNGKRINPNVEQPLFPGDTFTLAQNGPSFRLEKTGGQQTSALAVRSVDGKIYRADVSGKLSFGRSSSNNIQMAATDSAVSGSHCVLYHEGGKLYLKDLGSTNGTFFSEKERLKPNQAYRVNKGATFFLAKPSNSFTVIEE